MKGVLIGRPINGNEYVCDENRLAIVFDDENDARDFLKENGYTDEDIENNGIVFEPVDEEDEEDEE